MKRNVVLLVCMFLVSQMASELCAVEQNSTTGQSKITSINEIIEWKFSTGAKIYSTPLVQENVLYVGSCDNYFYAIDTNTGTEKWKFDTGTPIKSTAAIFENIVCFESGNVLFAVDKNSGTLKWNFTLYDKLQNSIDAWDYYHSSPCIVNGIAYIGTEAGKMYGVDVLTGEQKFYYNTGSRMAIRIMPLVNENVIYFGDWAGVVYAVNLTSGELIWSFISNKEGIDYNMSIQNTPVYLNNSIYFGSRSTKVFSLNSETGAENWAWKDGIGSWMCSTPVIEDSVLYVGGSDNHMLQAFHVRTGKKLWKFNTDYNLFTKPILTEDYIFITTGNSGGAVPNPLTPGSVFVINKNDGTTRNRLITPANNFSSPVLHDGIIYFGSNDGNIYAVDKNNLVNRPIPKTIFDTEMIDFGTVPVNSPDIEKTLMIYNTGDAEDSVSISYDYHAIKNTSAFTVYPSSFWLAAGDSQALVLKIKPSLLVTGFYLTTVNVNSTFNVSVDEHVMKKRIIFNITEAATGIEETEKLPEFYSLSQNYPNPFNMSTKIEYNLPKDSFVNIKVYNSLGQEKVTLVEQFQLAGQRSVSWDGTDSNSQILSSGVYFYCFEVNHDPVDIRKMILIK